MILMDVRELQYFITVVNQRGFTKAAEQLHISQPSLSNAIKRLEEEVGIQLIDRNTRFFRVTAEGKYFYSEALKLIQHFNLIKEEANKMKEKGPFELSIGLIESSLVWVPNVIINFKKKYSDVRVRLLEILSLQNVEDALLNFDIHLAITNQYIRNNDIDVIPLYKEKLVALLPIDHSLQRKKTVKLQDLANDSFIVCKQGFQSREDILQAFMQLGLRPNIQFEIERFETASQLVENKLGVTIVPENYVKYTRNGKYIVRKIVDMDIRRTVYLAYEKNRFLPEMVSEFMNLTREFFTK